MDIQSFQWTRYCLEEALLPPGMDKIGVIFVDFYENVVLIYFNRLMKENRACALYMNTISTSVYLTLLNLRFLVSKSIRVGHCCVRKSRILCNTISVHIRMANSIRVWNLITHPFRSYFTPLHLVASFKNYFLSKLFTHLSRDYSNALSCMTTLIFVELLLKY